MSETKNPDLGIASRFKAAASGLTSGLKSGLKSAVSGVKRKYNARNMKDDERTFELKGSKLKQLIGREINLEEFKAYKYKFYSFVAEFDLDESAANQTETQGIPDGGNFFLNTSNAPKINWFKFHKKWTVDFKLPFENTDQIAEYLGLLTFDTIKTKMEEGEVIEDIKNKINNVTDENKKWVKIGETNVFIYQQILQAYLREIVVEFEQSQQIITQERDKQRQEIQASKGTSLSSGTINISKSSWYKKFSYFPNVFLTFDKNDEPTAYFYDCNNKSGTYLQDLQKFFNVNTSDPSEAPTAVNDKIPLIYIYKNSKYKPIWGPLLQKKVCDTEGNEQETGESIDNGFTITEDNFKNYLTPAMKVKTPFEDFSKYEKFLGVQSNGAPEPVPDLENDPNEIDNQKNTLAKKILWNLACKASQKGWFPPSYAESQQDTGKGKNDENKDAQSSTGVGEVKEEKVKEEKVKEGEGEEGKTITDNVEVTDQATEQATGEEKKNWFGFGNNKATEGGNVDDFLKKMSSKKAMRIAWQTVPWKAGESDLDAKGKLNNSLKNVWKEEFCGYLGKAHNAQVPTAMYDVFATSSGYIRGINGGIREHYLQTINPEDGKLTLKNKNAVLGWFGGKRRRKSHRKSHKKTQKKHKKQMKKSHKKKTRGKKTRGKKC